MNFPTILEDVYKPILREISVYSEDELVSFTHKGSDLITFLEQYIEGNDLISINDKYNLITTSGDLLNEWKSFLAWGMFNDLKQLMQIL